MQRLASTLNNLTAAFAHRIAFEAVDSSGIFETWREEEGALNVLLGGKLKVILN